MPSTSQGLGVGPQVIYVGHSSQGGQHLALEAVCLQWQTFIKCCSAAPQINKLPCQHNGAADSATGGSKVLCSQLPRMLEVNNNNQPASPGSIWPGAPPHPINHPSSALPTSSTSASPCSPTEGLALVQLLLELHAEALGQHPLPKIWCSTHLLLQSAARFSLLQQHLVDPYKT